MIQIRDEIPADVAARERLLDLCFGEGRFAKTSQRLRNGRLPAAGLALTADVEGGLAATVRLWNVDAGAAPALLLGPIAVDPSVQGRGVGSTLMRVALARAEALGHAAVLLVGDAPYYARFGFGRCDAGLWMPGPFERERFLGLELRAGGLANAAGVVRATGALDRASAEPAFPTVAGAVDARRRAA